MHMYIESGRMKGFVECSTFGYLDAWLPWHQTMYPVSAWAMRQRHSSPWCTTQCAPARVLKSLFGQCARSLVSLECMKPSILTHISYQHHIVCSLLVICGPTDNEPAMERQPHPIQFIDMDSQALRRNCCRAKKWCFVVGTSWHGVVQGSPSLLARYVLWVCELCMIVLPSALMLSGDRFTLVNLYFWFYLDDGEVVTSTGESTVVLRQTCGFKSNNVGTFHRLELRVNWATNFKGFERVMCMSAEYVRNFDSCRDKG